MISEISMFSIRWMCLLCLTKPKSLSPQLDLIIIGYLYFTVEGLSVSSDSTFPEGRLLSWSWCWLDSVEQVNTLLFNCIALAMIVEQGVFQMLRCWQHSRLAVQHRVDPDQGGLGVIPANTPILWSIIQGRLSVCNVRLQHFVMMSWRRQPSNVWRRFLGAEQANMPRSYDLLNDGRYVYYQRPHLSLIGFPEDSQVPHFISMVRCCDFQYQQRPKSRFLVTAALSAPQPFLINRSFGQYMSKCFRSLIRCIRHGDYELPQNVPLGFDMHASQFFLVLSLGSEESQAKPEWHPRWEYLLIAE